MSKENGDNGSSRLVLVGIVVIGIIFGLVAGSLISSSVGINNSNKKIAVIPIDGGINGQMADETIEEIRKARTDKSVKAIVLEVNSPGGAASSSESLYLAVKRAQKKKPVVAYVDSIAASGGYYAIVPADKIIVKPSSMVGSVGVVFVSPRQLPPIDRVIISGPEKLTGGSQRDWYYATKSLQNSFVNSVLTNREEQLQIKRSELSRAGIYTGASAVNNGLADRIGDKTVAIKQAATLANIKNYRVIDMKPDTIPKFATRTAFVSSSADKKEFVGADYYVNINNSAPQFIMMPPSVIKSSIDTGNKNKSRNGGDTNE